MNLSVVPYKDSSARRFQDCNYISDTDKMVAPRRDSILETCIVEKKLIPLLHYFPPLLILTFWMLQICPLDIPNDYVVFRKHSSTRLSFQTFGRGASRSRTGRWLCADRGGSFADSPSLLMLAVRRARMKAVLTSSTQAIVNHCVRVLC